MYAKKKWMVRLSAYGLLGIICMSVLLPGQKKHKNRQTQQDMIQKWISLKIDEHSSEFHNLFICAKFECSTITTTKVTKV